MKYMINDPNPPLPVYGEDPVDIKNFDEICVWAYHNNSLVCRILIESNIKSVPNMVKYKILIAELITHNQQLKKQLITYEANNVYISRNNYTRG